jgi:cytochrome P450
MAHHNDTWKRQRKLVKQGLSPDTIMQYESVQYNVMSKLTNALVDDPSSLFSALRQFVFINI